MKQNLPPPSDTSSSAAEPRTRPNVMEKISSPSAGPLHEKSKPSVMGKPFRRSRREKMRRAVGFPTPYGKISKCAFGPDGSGRRNFLLSIQAIPEAPRSGVAAWECRHRASADTFWFPFPIPSFDFPNLFTSTAFSLRMKTPRFLSGERRRTSAEAPAERSFRGLLEERAIFFTFKFFSIRNERLGR